VVGTFVDARGGAEPAVVGLHAKRLISTVLISAAGEADDGRFIDVAPLYLRRSDKHFLG